jgi:hypothetical protein
MLAFTLVLFCWLACRFRSRLDLELEVMALRHQLAVPRRQRPGRTRFPTSVTWAECCLSSYVNYYRRSRTHLALRKDPPDSRPVETPDRGRVITLPQVGGLHQRYQRLAA